MSAQPRGFPGGPRLLVIAGLFVAVLVASNILAVKVASVGPFTTNAAIVLFPLAYLFGDVLTEVWGYAVARAVIWTGFVANAVVTLFVVVAIALPPAPSYTGQAGYAAVLSASPRLVLASFVAYLAGEFLNSFVLAKLKLVTRGRFLWTRTIGSTVVGQGVDSVIFTTVAFAGVLPGSVIVSIIGSAWVLKVTYEVVATPLTYAVVGYLKRAENRDTFDRDTNFAPIPLRGRKASGGLRTKEVAG